MAHPNMVAARLLLSAEHSQGKGRLLSTGSSDSCCHIICRCFRNLALCALVHCKQKFQVTFYGATVVRPSPIISTAERLEPSSAGYYIQLNQTP
jgi:hypothetical protein